MVRCDGCAAVVGGSCNNPIANFAQGDVHVCCVGSPCLSTALAAAETETLI